MSSWKWLISWQDFCCFCVFLGAVIQRSGSLFMTSLSSSASYSEVPQTTCEGKKWMRKERKINRFPLSGWAVSLACQRSCYSGGTRATWADTQSLLTRGKHADRHQEQVGTQICTSSSRPNRYCARPPCGNRWGVGLRMVGKGVGWKESQPTFFYCLTVSLSSKNAFIPR